MPTRLARIRDDVADDVCDRWLVWSLHRAPFLCCVACGTDRLQLDALHGSSCRAPPRHEHRLFSRSSVSFGATKTGLSLGRYGEDNKASGFPYQFLTLTRGPLTFLVSYCGPPDLGTRRLPLRGGLFSGLFSGKTPSSDSSDPTSYSSPFPHTDYLSGSTAAISGGAKSLYQT